MRRENTGIRVSDEHKDAALARASGVVATPIIVHGRPIHDDARRSFGDWLDALAQAYGLPAPTVVDGEVVHYGMTEDGEFTRWAGEDACPPQDILGT